MQKSLILLKPDCLEKKFVGEVISRFESEGYSISAIKMVQLDSSLLQKHYSHVAHLPFFPEIASFMSSRPVMALILEGDDVISGVRDLIGPTDSTTAVPSISVGYDTSEKDATTNSNTTAYFVGLNWTDVINADDKIGLAFGQPQMVEGETIEPFLYELYYKYKVNDSVSITPTIFGGTSKNSSNAEADMTGYLLQTTFKF